MIDGQLVRVALEGGAPEEKIVIPQAALISDQEGVYVFIASDGKAADTHESSRAARVGAGVVVEQGLTGGEQVVVEGIQALRPDVPVRPTVLPPSPDRS